VDYELKEILLKAKKRVFSNLSGENLTRLKGDGIDLRDIKEYEWGDDIRRINWKATAKTGEILVNTYDEYKRLNITLIFLASSTINFGSKRLKQDVVAEIFAYLLFSAFKNNDFCKTIIFSNKVLKEYSPVRNINEIDMIVKDIYDFNTIGEKIDYEKLNEELNKRYKKGEILIFVGDFFDIKGFHIANKKHQTYSIIVRDEIEENLDFEGEISFKDPLLQKDEEFFINESIKKEYKKLLKNHDKKIKEVFIKNQIDFTKIKTNEDVYFKLLELFK